MNDLKFAFRQLLKNPGFTAVVVLTLALGIGANTAVFSFVNAILLRPLPYKDSDRLVMLFESNREKGWDRVNASLGALREWRQQATAFEALAARGLYPFTLTGQGQPEYVQGTPVSANTFRMLRIQPVLGRDFLPEEETYGKHFVAMLSYEWWKQRFNGDSNIIGRTLTLNGEPYTVIGVMAAHTDFPDPGRHVWVPLAFSPDQIRNRGYSVYGRLKPGVSLEQASAEMNLISQRIGSVDEEFRGWGVEIHPLREMMVSDSRRVLLILLGSVSFVLLIACANIANLLLTRAASRSRELAVRSALGAERSRIIRQLLTENLLLASIGGMAGVLFAWSGLALLLRLAPPDLPRVWEGIDLDGSTLAFTSLITVLAGLVFGLAPALQFANPSLTSELKENMRGSSVGPRRQRLRGFLVVSEVGLSLVLLIAAGLLIRSFAHLISQDLGYTPQHLVSMGVSLLGKRSPEKMDQRRFFEQFLAQVQTLPGVRSAALVFGLPLTGLAHNQCSVQIEGNPPPVPGEPSLADYAQISPGYFRTMNIPVLEGRDFAEQDRTNTVPVVVVDQSFVRSFNLATNVVGRRIVVSDSAASAEIIGVVKDTKRAGMAEAPRGTLYRNYKQVCWGFMTLIVRTERDPTEMSRAIRSEMEKLDKDQPVLDSQTMTELVASSVAQQRLVTELLAFFAAVALLRAVLGLYGVLAYNVAKRTQEIGIRIALGAQITDVLSLVLRQGMALVVTGMALGLVGALGLTRILQTLLFEVKPFDPLTFLFVILGLGAVALLACWLPARRAARVNPMEALRYE